MSALSEDAILALDDETSSAGAGAMPPFEGFGYQGAQTFRGERYRATESPYRFRARDAEMLGTTDKDPQEKVWYEAEFRDILRGATILTCEVSATTGLTVHTSEHNGHLARALVSRGLVNETYFVAFYCQCSDGSVRLRRLRIRGREQ